MYKLLCTKIYSNFNTSRTLFLTIISDMQAFRKTLLMERCFKFCCLSNICGNTNVLHLLLISIKHASNNNKNKVKKNLIICLPKKIVANYDVAFQYNYMHVLF
jgi:hypothetical protein